MEGHIHACGFTILQNKYHQPRIQEHSKLSQLKS